jgi:hypothetical protein
MPEITDFFGINASKNRMMKINSKVFLSIAVTPVTKAKVVLSLNLAFSGNEVRKPHGMRN